MDYLLALSAVILVVTAMPIDDFNGEYDPGRQPDAFTTNVNFTNFVSPTQSGFASTNGGTYGGNGGIRWTVWDAWALRDAVRGNNRKLVTVRGRIDLTLLFTGSPGVRLAVGSFTSIFGGDRDAMIVGGGLYIRQVRQVTIENIKIHNALSYAPEEQPNGNGGIISMVPGPFSEIDNIGIESSEHVWVHHCEFSDDPWIAAASPADSRRHDGLIDITYGANWITISNSIFRNHNHVSLIGNSDNLIADRGRLKVTWHNNWFQGVVQRCPRVRFGEVHIVNNLYTDVVDYAIGVGVEASIISERNVFINTRRAWGWAVTSIPDARAYYLSVDNMLVNSKYDNNIPSDGVTWRPYHYYSFSAQNVSIVEAHVRRYAGTFF